MRPSSRRKDWLVDCPELGMFPTPDAAKQAVKEIDREVNRSGGTWVVAAVIGVGSYLTFRLAYWLLTVVSANALAQNQRSWIAFGVVIVAVVAFSVWAVRTDYPKLIRKKLLAVGVPVCLKCGYNLTGLASDTERCPECGAGLDAKVGSILRGEDAS